MLTDEQKKQRMNGLGASDSPIIMGYSSYKTPYELYLEKTGMIENEETENELQYWGNQIEPLILKRFEKENGVEIIFPGTVYHADHPYIFANLDGFCPALNAVVEAKMANSFQRKLWDDSIVDGIPFQYLIQIAKQVCLADVDKGYCAVLIGGNEYKQFLYERDEQLEKLIIKSDLEFWDCVVNRKEPAAINTSDCRLKYKTPSPDKIVSTNFRVEKTFYELYELKSDMKTLNAQEEKLKTELMSYIGNAEYLTDQNGEILVTWKATKKGNRVFNIKG